MVGLPQWEARAADVRLSPTRSQAPSTPVQLDLNLTEAVSPKWCKDNKW